MKLLLCCFLLCLSVTLSAQTPLSKLSWAYSGTVDKQPISLEVNLQDAHLLYGAYRSTATDENQAIDLVGVLNDNGDFYLYELTGDGSTFGGTFKGRFSNNFNTMTGSWLHPSNNTSVAFTATADEPVRNATTVIFQYLPDNAFLNEAYLRTAPAHIQALVAYYAMQHELGDCDTESFYTLLKVEHRCSDAHLSLVKKYVVPLTNTIECTGTPCGATSHTQISYLSVVDGPSDGDDMEVHYLTDGYYLRGGDFWNGDYTDHFQLENGKWVEVE